MGEFYGRLREAWEAFVEHELLNGAVKAHEPGIHTQNLKAVGVSTADYKTIHFAMAKCSRWLIGHKESPAADVNRPKPEELRSDIEALASFSKAIRSENDERRKEREAALQPPTTAIG